MATRKRFKIRRKKGSIAKQALALAKSNKRKLKEVETKYFDDVSSGSLSAAGTGTLIGPLSAMIEGTAEQERVSQEIKAINLSMKLNLAGHASNASIAWSRVVVFRDFDCQGANPSYTDIFTANNEYAFRNLTNTSRFKIYYDKLHKVTGSSSVEGGREKWIVKHWRLSHSVTFSGSAAAIANCAKGHLFIYIMGDQATNTVGYNCVTRFRFNDA